MSKITKTVTTTLSKKLVTEKAIIELSLQDYELINQTDTTFIFEGGKDINKFWLIVGIILFFLPAVAYYFLAKNHKILFTIKETDSGTSVQSSTTTPESMRVARLFLLSLEHLDE